MNNVVLIGFMGTGKSVVGKRLARTLDFDFFDTDRFIEHKTGQTVAQIFEDGEERFRLLEVEAVQEAVRQDRRVVSTGGGLVANPVNWNRLSQYGTLVWLRARPSLILQRIQKRPGQRPLLNVPDPEAAIKCLLDERVPYYQRADITMDTSDLGVDEIVAQIKKKVSEFETNAHHG